MHEDIPRKWDGESEFALEFARSGAGDWRWAGRIRAALPGINIGRRLIIWRERLMRRSTENIASAYMEMTIPTILDPDWAGGSTLPIVTAFVPSSDPKSSVRHLMYGGFRISRTSTLKRSLQIIISGRYVLPGSAGRKSVPAPRVCQPETPANLQRNSLRPQSHLRGNSSSAFKSG